jgi:hypothetical protein
MHKTNGDFPPARPSCSIKMRAWRTVVVAERDRRAHHPLCGRSQRIAFATGAEREHGDLLVNLLGTEHSKVAEDGEHHLLVEGYGYRWYRVGGLDYWLRRTDIG